MLFAGQGLLKKYQHHAVPSHIHTLEYSNLRLGPAIDKRNHDSVVLLDGISEQARK